MSGSLVIVNPRASRVRAAGAAALLPSVVSALTRRDGVAPDVVTPEDADAVAGHVRAALDRGVAAVVGLGGDGTQRGIAEVLVGTDVPLGILPAGTGNILGGVLGIPSGLREAIESLAAAAPRAIDLGDVSLFTTDLAPGDAPRHTICAIGCGIGFDARLMATTEAGHKARFGRYAYLFQAIRLASRIEAVPYRITVDGRLIELEASIAMITNVGDLVPGVIRPRLAALPDDGQLDLFVVAARGVVDGIRGLADHLLRTTTGGDSTSRTLRFRCRSARVESVPPEPIQVDGDPCGTGAIEVSVLPGALRVLVPRGRMPEGQAPRTPTDR
jgi:diacylglycerol kinase (ATP)